ncbi:MAG: type 2 isopentenyl-diphosphate Delta-isomerase [Alphaproteobacteria bacterium]|jgi:isopentenyl-diphosphate Delta-isomerase|nr:type 2 isopentenyl-diphosphate Delta-isomerase [Alphaproteobacteria bacterium]MBT4019003.1 type 2 isopentenyl-diphosphate Delta-isomerase [Alphaproteobacteria bacterium]MBT4965628.1 type 2 isopentenyl-diphosphate Delta-isomerase [Alphaproteobacteria bacterium]MBT5159497.1 type 2 isopentenyl-diphosphate Delta-isomerase [Alphaproteobacteria bacterium]MBT5918761.1 type 2 isopentenyl-diphosphate Delta-isomerase [Alphaproteobacteria bacterium]
MSDPSIRQRKLDHVALAMSDAAVSACDPGWSDVTLVPVTLPETSPDDVDLALSFLGFDLRAPILIAGMTGGHPDVEKINAALATAAQAHGVAMGVGSQRAALLDPDLVPSYAIVRQHAPDAFICGNIGISQVLEGETGTDILARLVDMVEANALAVHINVLQELVQPEGDIKPGGAFEALGNMVAKSPVPVIVKETGCGFDQVTANRLKDTGIAAIDVGGMGGTSFTLIEGMRAETARDRRGARLAQTFSTWGIPTACSVLEVRDTGLPIIATGGISDGLQAAKALSLGAHLVGIGRKMLTAAVAGPEAAVEELGLIIEEIRISLALSDCRNLKQFATRQSVLSGKVALWQAHKQLTKSADGSDEKNIGGTD